MANEGQPPTFSTLVESPQLSCGCLWRLSDALSFSTYSIYFVSALAPRSVSLRALFLLYSVFNSIPPVKVFHLVGGMTPLRLPRGHRPTDTSASITASITLRF
jgi:hypothetical protein